MPVKEITIIKSRVRVGEWSGFATDKLNNDTLWLLYPLTRQSKSKVGYVMTLWVVGEVYNIKADKQAKAKLSKIYPNLFKGSVSVTFSIKGNLSYLTIEHICECYKVARDEFITMFNLKTDFHSHRFEEFISYPDMATLCFDDLRQLLRLRT